MNRTRCVGLTCLLLVTLVAPPVGASAPAPSHFDVAMRWAPVIMQDTDDSNHPADYITSFDFDGDWRGNNNWENLGSGHATESIVYYSVAETQTHYFILYALYYARDWWEACNVFQCHENDMTGALLVIAKGGAGSTGQFRAMITLAGADFESYVRKPTTWHDLATMPVSGHEDVDGFVKALWHRPVLFVTAKQHDAHGDEAWIEDGFPGGDGLLYRPGSTPTTPRHGDDRSVTYALRDLTELHSRRSDYTETFAAFGRLRGDTYADNAALAPWAWDDPNDGPTYAGEVFYRPARLVDHYFNNLGSFSHTYVGSSDNARRY